MLKSSDINQLKSVGITEDMIYAQLSDLKSGYEFLKIDRAATINNGILRMTEASHDAAIETWKEYCGRGEQRGDAEVAERNHSIVKFVPASGAASRMFKELYEYINTDGEVEPTAEVKRFFDNIGRFAFYEELDRSCLQHKSASVSQLIQRGEYKAVLEVLLDAKYMAYGVKPKGLLSFHKYENEVRTAVAEHLVEGALYAANADREVNIHFTVSQEHMQLFQRLIDNIAAEYETRYNVKYSVSMSVQKPSTDTVALGQYGDVVRNEDGSILLRPGGHGALIENLNDIEADVVFIKNIDNVVPDRLKDTTVEYKQVLAGVLVTYQRQIFEYMRELERGGVTDARRREMLDFAENILCVRAGADDEERGEKYLYRIFNRPIRVCGMVKNEGEPGGGPYLVYDGRGVISPQILESSQIDKANPTAVECMKRSEYFNPVDLVCGVRNHKGERFDLTKFVDRKAGFISEKSKNGKSMKVLELPGLWNGAMSDWNTIFIEVPVATFNPVKTVNDLLREQHI